MVSNRKCSLVVERFFDRTEVYEEGVDFDLQAESTHSLVEQSAKRSCNEIESVPARKHSFGERTTSDS